MCWQNDIFNEAQMAFAKINSRCLAATVILRTMYLGIYYHEMATMISGYVGILSSEEGILSSEVGILSSEVGILSSEVGILSFEVGMVSRNNLYIGTNVGHILNVNVMVTFLF